MRAAFALACLAGATACAADDAPPAPTACAEAYDPVAERIAVAEPELLEVSGLVASRRDPRILWAHNDSGDVARLFALGTDGAALARLTLPGEAGGDYEDLAAAPCPDDSGPCLWLADTGDNALARDDLGVYAIPEPAIDPAVPPGELTATSWWRFPLAYPAGVIVDVEAVVVTTTPRRVYLIEKVDAATARIFAADVPALDGALLAATEVGVVTAPGLDIARGRMITSADLHPDEDRVVLRVYTGVFEYRLAPGGTPADLDAAELVLVAYGPITEPQGEAVAYAADGVDLWTMSEDPELAATQPLHWLRCELR